MPITDLKLLKEFGIKTIVNFRNNKDWIEREREWTEEIGLNYVSIPWRIWGKLRPDVGERFFDVIDNKNNCPVFIHCKRGADRTGTIAALYRVVRQGVSLDDAIREAREYDMRFYFKGTAKNQIEHMIKRLKKDRIE